METINIAGARTTAIVVCQPNPTLHLPPQKSERRILCLKPNSST
jgi:hypothetical protein